MQSLPGEGRAYHKVPVAGIPDTTCIGLNSKADDAVEILVADTSLSYWLQAFANRQVQTSTYQLWSFKRLRIQTVADSTGYARAQAEGWHYYFYTGLCDHLPYSADRWCGLPQSRPADHRSYYQSRVCKWRYQNDLLCIYHGGHAGRTGYPWRQIQESIPVVALRYGKNDHQYGHATRSLGYCQYPGTGTLSVLCRGICHHWRQEISLVGDMTSGSTSRICSTCLKLGLSICTSTCSCAQVV